MATTIFIGKLSYDTTEETLTQVLSQYGEVKSVKIIIDRDTNRPKGFAFADMADEEAMNAAIKGIDGMELDGRKIVANEAKPREDRPRQPRQQSNSFRRSW